MTLIEFFTTSPFENIVSAMSGKPEKIIYLGERDELEQRIQCHREFLETQGIHNAIEEWYVDSTDLNNIIRALTDIVTHEPDCVVDVSGGEDLILLAAGIVYERYSAQYPFSIQRVDLCSGKIVDCINNVDLTLPGYLSVSVDHLISLHGGSIVPEHPQPSDPKHIEDINLLWDISKPAPAEWNWFLTAWSELRNKGNNGCNDLNVNLNLRTPSAPITNFHAKFSVVEKFLLILEQHSLIQNLTIGYDDLSFQFKNRIVARTFEKAGNILELKVYFEACNLKENGRPCFNNYYLGVNIDWDGIPRLPWEDTRNEIDVVLMKGLTPIFISCKNGKLKESEIYKLSVVASRFGGKHAKKALIISDFDGDDRAKTSLYQRCKDMDIHLIYDAAALTNEEWHEFLINLA